MRGAEIPENCIIIPDNAGSTTFTTVIIIIAILFVTYEVVTILLQALRYRKLKRKSEENEGKTSGKSE